MKIVKRDQVFINTVIFTFGSLFFLLAIDALSANEFLFNTSFLVKSLLSNYLIITVWLLVLFLVFAFKKFSQWIFLFYLIMVVVKSFFYLSSSFNKLVLGLNFVYVLFAFYFFTNWELFLNAAIHNPMFSENDLEKETRFSMNGKLLNKDIEIDFRLTNIDDDGCFVLFSDESIHSKINFNEIYTLKITLEGVEFSSKVKCVSRYDRGMGLSFIGQNENDLRSMSGFYQVCLERGLI